MQVEVDVGRLDRAPTCHCTCDDKQAREVSFHDDLTPHLHLRWTSTKCDDTLPLQLEYLMVDPAVAAGKVVLFHYTLTVEGNVIDSSRGRGEPLVYLHGPATLSRASSARWRARPSVQRSRLPSRPRATRVEGPGPQRVPRNQFPKDVATGMSFFAETSTGERVQLWVTKVEGAAVWADTNHPLGDKTLNFDVEITAIRDATSEEMAHGHAHGPTGPAATTTTTRSRVD